MPRYYDVYYDVTNLDVYYDVTNPATMTSLPPATMTSLISHYDVITPATMTSLTPSYDVTNPAIMPQIGGGATLPAYLLLTKSYTFQLTAYSTYGSVKSLEV